GGASDDTVKETITVSAAASLVDALEEVSERFNEEHPGVQVEFNFGGSGALMQRILQGAPADLFFSANESHFEEVVDEGYIDEGNTVDLLHNERSEERRVGKECRWRGSREYARGQRRGG